MKHLPQNKNVIRQNRLFSVALEPLEARIAPAMLMVTTANDNGPGSLRAEITASHAGDEIDFAIPGTGPQTIDILSPLPAITHALTIDARTQTHYSGTPLIVLEGVTAGAGAVGLELDAASCAVYGLAIIDFSEAGVQIDASSSGCTVKSCFIGVGPNGQVPGGNHTGIEVDGNGNFIGGAASGEGNLIAGNATAGILVNGDGNQIVGNHIGTDATGIFALGNGTDGITILGSNNTIGGTSTGAGNLISGNLHNGITLQPSGLASGNIIQGNFIGTDAAGTAALGNGGDGIDVFSASNTVGGTSVGAGNLISGNAHNGVTIGPASGSGTAGNIVQGNLIGVSVGLSALGNGGNGVDVTGDTANATIGGVAPGAANTIAYNVIGVALESGVSNPTGITISANSIHDNSGLGIDLGADGVTANHPGDTVAGPNGFLNYPVITKTTVGASNVLSIAGTYSGPLEAQKITLEFFSNPTADSSGHGQGQVYLGSTVISTGTDGLASFTAAFQPNSSVSLGAITATATDAAGNTSEFALDSAPVAAPQVTVNGHSASYTDIDGDHVTVTTTHGTFSADMFTTAASGLGLQLNELDVSDASFNGANLSFSVKKSATGDGLAAVGLIDGGANDFGTITIKGDLGAIDCGSATAATALASLSVRSMGEYGLATQFGGTLASHLDGSLGKLQVAGDVDGELLSVSGSIGPVSIGGSLSGHSSSGVNYAGQIYAGGAIGLVKIGLNLQGGGGLGSGAIYATGTLAGVNIGGSIVGGSGQYSGYIYSGGAMGKVTIGHELRGGSGMESGLILAEAKLAGASVGGSVFGGSAEFTGEIFSTGDMGTVKVGGNLEGGSLAPGATASLDHTGCIRSEGRIAAVSIGGSVDAGTNDASALVTLSFSGSIQADADIGSLTVHGHVSGTVGATGAVTKATISAAGPASPTATSDLAFGKITIGGRVADAQILAGYNDAGNTLNNFVTAANGAAQIGSVSVGGDWIASDLVAGVQEAHGASGFGGVGDAIIGTPAHNIAKIASIVIKGIVLGSPETGDQFAFESHSIGKISIDGSAIQLPAAGDAIMLSPITEDDVKVWLL